MLVCSPPPPRAHRVQVSKEKPKDLSKAENAMTDVAMNPMFTASNLKVRAGGVSGVWVQAMRQQVAHPPIHAVTRARTLIIPLDDPIVWLVAAQRGYACLRAPYVAIPHTGKRWGAAVLHE